MIAGGPAQVHEIVHIRSSFLRGWTQCVSVWRATIRTVQQDKTAMSFGKHCDDDLLEDLVLELCV